MATHELAGEAGPGQSDVSPGEAPHRWFGQTEATLVVICVLVLNNDWISTQLGSPALRTWTAMFVAIVVQSLPFLVAGVVVAAGITALVPDRFWKAALPQQPALAVPVAGVAGIGLIGCECASVPIAGSVMRKGVPAAVALTFLLAAPAVNPVVIVSTVVAFPDAPEMAAARFVASMAVAVTVGWLWMLVGKRTPPRLSADLDHAHGRGFTGFLTSVQHDLVQAGGYVVLGAMIAAAVNTFVPAGVLDSLGSHPVLGVLVLAAFAFVVALCSQTDAFVAASLTAFSPTARLVFLVVGPVMDVKLATLEAGVFGRRFAGVFVPLVLVVATTTAAVVGWWLL